jgi:HAD superfamily hydrolase (TIGR01509 family)
MNVTTVLFDLDGVLLETEYFQWQGWVEVLKPLKVELTKNDYFNYAGKTGSIVEAELVKNFKLDVPKGSLLEKKEKLLMEWFSTKQLKLMPYAKEAIEHFINNGYKIALASSGPRDEVILKLKRSGLLHFFKVIVSRDDVKRGKPYPDIYLAAAKKVGSQPAECVVFEDTEYGVLAGKAAGMTCVAIPQEYSAYQDFSKADVKVKNLKEAAEWVETQCNHG